MSDIGDNLEQVLFRQIRIERDKREERKYIQAMIEGLSEEERCILVKILDLKIWIDWSADGAVNVFFPQREIGDKIDLQEWLGSCFRADGSRLEKAIEHRENLLSWFKIWLESCLERIFFAFGKKDFSFFEGIAEQWREKFKPFPIECFCYALDVLYERLVESCAGDEISPRAIKPYFDRLKLVIRSEVEPSL